MAALVALAVFLVVAELAAVRGWGADSRDGRDWTRREPARGAHGVVHMPRSWWR